VPSGDTLESDTSVNTDDVWPKLDITEVDVPAAHGIYEIRARREKCPRRFDVVILEEGSAHHNE
jgi:hypothetical protein